MVKQSEVVGHRELVEGGDTGLHGHAGGRLPVFTSRPIPSTVYLGRRIIVRAGAGVESEFYVCALNEADEHEWFQLGGPAKYR